jgi:hypothetical protein
MGVTPIYNIPFAEPTDLVRDWPGLSEDVAEAVEAAVAGVPVLAGIGSNVVQTVKTDPFTMSSSTYAAVTGLAVTITPTSATSKVLVIASLSWNLRRTTGGQNAWFRLVRASTAISVGDAVGSRPQATGSFGFGTVNSNTGGAAAMFLDSPGVATATTYSIEVATGIDTLAINTTSDDSDSTDRARTVSSIMAIEVAV